MGRQYQGRLMEGIFAYPSAATVLGQGGKEVDYKRSQNGLDLG